MNGPRFLYGIELETSSVVTATIDWGNEPGWLTTYASELANADLIRLTRKGQGGNGSIEVEIGVPESPILFSRVVGRNGAGYERQVRLYAIGWSRENPTPSQQITWVYPNGETEVADEPTFTPYP